MKRVLAILVALMVCACSVSALAERTSVTMKESIVDDKLCIEIPEDWTWMDLPEDLAEDGYLLIGVDDLNEMVACYRVIDRDVNMDIGDWATELIEEDENIAEVTLKVNPNGLYVLEYITEDQRVAGCLTIVDENTALSFDCRYADVTKTLEEACWPKTMRKIVSDTFLLAE
ncbi:MAG: hypothetical protein E7331_10780 [Clostridiales bacterium]|nr:hypothetical protein [Clostridiales bacterium]